MALEKPTIVIFDMDGTTVRHLSPTVLWLAETYDDSVYRVSKFFGWLFHRKAKGPILPEAEEEKRKTVRKRRLPVP